MLLFNTLLVVVLLLLIIITYYFSFSNFYLDRVKKENSYQIESLKSGIDHEIQKILAMPILHFSNSFAITEDPLELYYTSRALISIASYYSTVASVDVYAQKEDLFLINGHLILENNEQNQYRIPRWYQKYLETQDNQFWYYQEDLIYYVSTLPLYGRNIDGIIAIQLETSFLQALFYEAAHEQRQYAIVDKEENLIFSPWFTSADAVPLPINTTEPTTITIDDKLIVTVPSLYNDWVYISIEPLDSLQRSLGGVIFFTILIGIVFIVIGAIITYVVTRAIHKPISHTIQTLHSSLEQEKPIIKQNILLKLFEQNVLVHEITQEEYELGGISLEAPYAFVFSLELVEKEYLTAGEVLPLYFNLVAVLEEYGCYAIYDTIHEVIVSCVLYKETDSLSSVVHQIDSLIYSLQEYTYRIRIGTQVSLNHESIHNSYINLLTCRSYDFLYQDTRLLTYDALDIPNRINFSKNPNMLHKVEQALKARDQEKSKELVTHIVDAFAKQPYAIDFCRNTLRDLVSRIYNTIPALGLNQKQLFQKDIRDTCRTISTLQEFSTWIHEVLDIIYKVNPTYLNDTQTHLHADIEQYIRTHLHEISQDLVATAFNMRADTFSRTFSELFGENYSTYLRRLQIAEAKKLLKDQEMTVAQVAKTLGFSTSQYFIRIFKASEGTTPHRYQKNLAKL